MVFNSSFEKPKGKGDALDHKAETTVGAQGRVLSKHHNSSRRGHSSAQRNWFFLAYMVLAKNNHLQKDDKDNTFEKDICMHSLDSTVLKKKKSMVLSTMGGGDDSHGSNECLLPGLYDDVALDCLARTCTSDYPSLACLNRRFRELVSSGYLKKVRQQLGILNYWVYVACSLMPWEAFDPATRTWTRLPKMPCDECFSCADKESLAVGTQLLVFGRELTGFAIWMYSHVKRDWSRCPLMNIPRCLFGSGSYGAVAIVSGGSDKNGQVLKCAEMYNSEMGTWETLPDMNMPRKMCSSFFMDGKFYVIGGMSSHTDSLSCGEEYDLKTKTWRRIPDMYPGGNKATQSPPLVAVVNNQLYAADQGTNEVKKYDKKNNTWKFVRPLPVRADSYNGWGLGFKACGDKLLVIGGHRGPQGEVIVLHSWCPEKGNGEGGEWNVLSVRERAGAFVYNCAVMGC